MGSRVRRKKIKAYAVVVLHKVAEGRKGWARGYGRRKAGDEKRMKRRMDGHTDRSTGKNTKSVVGDRVHLNEPASGRKRTKRCRIPMKGRVYDDGGEGGQVWQVEVYMT